MCRNRNSGFTFGLLCLLLLLAARRATPQESPQAQVLNYLTQVNQELKTVSQVSKDQSATIATLRNSLQTQAKERASERGMFLVKLKSSEDRATASLNELNTANGLLSVAKSSLADTEEDLRSMTKDRDKEKSLREFWRFIALTEGLTIVVAAIVFFLLKKLKAFGGVLKGLFSFFQ